MGSISVENMEPGPLPYWQVNVPPSQRTAECPEGLRDLTPKDIGIISTPDSTYRYQTWDEVCSFVGSNKLELFLRIPSQLRRYRLYMHQLIKRHGSVMNFVLEHRLGWAGACACGPGGELIAVVEPSGKRPFEDDGDWKILWNDWPYGVDPRIVHLVVWIKFTLEEDPVTGDLTEESRADVEGFVSRTFRTHLAPNSVIWFRNWASLKSVHAVEHFHVMLYDPPDEFVRQVTSGDTPASASFEP